MNSSLSDLLDQIFNSKIHNSKKDIQADLDPKMYDEAKPQFSEENSQPKKEEVSVNEEKKKKEKNENDPRISPPDPQNQNQSKNQQNELMEMLTKFFSGLGSSGGKGGGDPIGNNSGGDNGSGNSSRGQGSGNDLGGNSDQNSFSKSSPQQTQGDTNTLNLRTPVGSLPETVDSNAVGQAVQQTFPNGLTQQAILDKAPEYIKNIYSNPDKAKEFWDHVKKYSQDGGLGPDNLQRLEMYEQRFVSGNCPGGKCVLTPTDVEKLAKATNFQPQTNTNPNASLEPNPSSPYPLPGNLTPEDLLAGQNADKKVGEYREWEGGEVVNKNVFKFECDPETKECIENHKLIADVCPLYKEKGSPECKIHLHNPPKSQNESIPLKATFLHNNFKKAENKIYTNDVKKSDDGKKLIIDEKGISREVKDNAYTPSPDIKYIPKK
jgi:hypothetical protein